MSDEDRSLDLTGMGKLAKAIPPSSWNKLVTTACKTFTDFVKPITATTIGLGKYIEAKFDRFVDAEKILAAETIRRAQEKVKNSSSEPKGNFKPVVVIQSISAAGTQTEEAMHDLWSSLLAREILNGEIHPEIPKILERMVSSDAQVLAEVARGSDDQEAKAAVKRIKEISGSISLFGIATSISQRIELVEKDYPFTYAHLENLGLIYSTGKKWALTPVGKEFIRCVSDPSIEIEKSQPSAPADAKKPRR